MITIIEPSADGLLLKVQGDISNVLSWPNFQVHAYVCIYLTHHNQKN